MQMRRSVSVWGSMRSPRRSSMWSVVVTTSLLLCGCKANHDTAAIGDQEGVPGRLSATSAPASTAGSGGAADTDVAARGSGLPAGYVAQLDQPTARISDASYKEDGNGRWEVRTGPAHILYSLKDTTRKRYSVTATFEQLERPAHPEAYGVFVGGSSLEKPASQRYTYFLVRGTGEYLLKVREGAHTRTVIDWTPHPALPKQDSAGKVVYGIKIESDGKTAKVSVNGKPVTTFTARQGPLEGVAGVRINHNLHLMVTPAHIVQ